MEEFCLWPLWEGIEHQAEEEDEKDDDLTSFINATWGFLHTISDQRISKWFAGRVGDAQDEILEAWYIENSGRLPTHQIIFLLYRWLVWLKPEDREGTLKR